MSEQSDEAMAPAPAPMGAKARVAAGTTRLTRSLAGFYAWRKAVEDHPLWGTCFAAGMLVLGIAGSIAVDHAKRWYFGPDEFLIQIAEDQKQQFADLKKNLGQLRGSISSDDRAAFGSVQNAVQQLEGSNAELIQQLVLAKQENDSLRTASEKAGHVSGGYDFLLSERAGMRLDSQNVLGLSRVAPETVALNLSSTSGPPQSKDYLHSGESLAYRSARGQSCRVTVMAIHNGDPGTASFALACG